MTSSATGKERLGLKRVGKWLTGRKGTVGFNKVGKMVGKRLGSKRVGKWLAHQQE